MTLLFIGLLLSYVSTGLEMVIVHIDGPPEDAPAYVGGSLSGKICVGAIWPYVCKRNGELAWYFCNFVGSLIFNMVYLALITPHISYLWAIVILTICKAAPFTSTIVKVPIVIVSSITFAILSRVFGWKIPGSIARFSAYEEYKKRERRLWRQLG